MLERVDEIQEESRERSSADGHANERAASLVMMLFEPVEVGAEEGSAKRTTRTGERSQGRRRGSRAAQPSPG